MGLDDKHERWTFAGTAEELDAELKSIASRIFGKMNSEVDWLDDRGDDDIITDILRECLVDGVYRG